MTTINVIRAFISRGLPERKRNVMSAAGSGSCATCVMTVTSDFHWWIMDIIPAKWTSNDGHWAAERLCVRLWAELSVTWRRRENSCRSVCLFDLLRWKEILGSWKRRRKITKEVMQMRHVVPDWRPHLRLYTQTADRGRLRSDEISDCRLLD